MIKSSKLQIMLLQLSKFIYVIIFSIIIYTKFTIIIPIIYHRAITSSQLSMFKNEIILLNLNLIT